MPGEVVEFSAQAASLRLVAALANLTANQPHDFVLIGGLAVAARLHTFHRATQDLDALVTDEHDRFQALTLEGVTGAVLEHGKLTVNGVTVDIIEIDATTAFTAIAELPERIDQLFTAGHLFAHNDAVSLELRSGTRVATVKVASARSLLITKLHAYLNPQRDDRKHPSDAIDILELGRQLVASDSSSYGDDVPDLVRTVAKWGISQIRERPEELIRRLAKSGHQVPLDEIIPLLDLLITDLT